MENVTDSWGLVIECVGVPESPSQDGLSLPHCLVVGPKKHSPGQNILGSLLAWEVDGTARAVSCTK